MCGTTEWRGAKCVKTKQYQCEQMKNNKCYISNDDYHSYRISDGSKQKRVCLVGFFFRDVCLR